MSIEFKNNLHESVTEQQAKSLKHYFKVFKENNVEKLEEEYYDGQLLRLYYNKGSQETNQDVMNKLFIPGKMITIRERQSVTGAYVLEKEFNYDASGTLMGKNNHLYDPNGDLVAFETIDDLASNEPDYPHTRKYFYDRNINPDGPLFECFYKNDGTLDHIYYNNYHLNPDGQDSEAFTDDPADIRMLRTLTGISQDLADYYVSADVTPQF